MALLGIEILLSAASVTVELGKSSFDPLTLIGPLVGMLNLAVAVVMYRFIARGRNWARIAFLVLWLISFLYQATWIYASVGVAPESVRYAVSWTAVASMALPHLLSLAIVILLFGPGRAWFREPQAD